MSTNPEFAYYLTVSYIFSTHVRLSKDITIYLCLTSSTPPYSVQAFVTFYGSFVNFPSCFIVSPYFMTRSVDRCPLPQAANILGNLYPSSNGFIILKSFILAKFMYWFCFSKFFLIFGLNSLSYLLIPVDEMVFTGFGSFYPN